MSITDLRKIFDLNFFSVFYLTKLFLPEIKKRKGSIINVSSVAGKVYIPYMGGYCASKYAFNAFSDSLRADKRKCTCFRPDSGRIKTGSTLFGSSPEKFAGAFYKARIKKKGDNISRLVQVFYRNFLLSETHFLFAFGSLNLKIVYIPFYCIC